MKIYWIKAQAPRRVLALAKHLGVDAEFVEVAVGGLRALDYVALNPNMKAPTLVDGDTVLWESSAIMAWLCIRQGSDMWPARDPAAQVEVLRWLSWNDCHWGPAVGREAREGRDGRREERGAAESERPEIVRLRAEERDGQVAEI